jgi:NADPH2:quinone reductase
MKAIQCVAYDELPSKSIRVVTLPLPEPEPQSNTIIVDVLTMTVDFVQLLLTQRKYQVRAQPPFTLGGEMVGRVLAVGDGVEGLDVGDLVTGSAMSKPGPDGAPFQNHGAWAERVEAEAGQVCKLPLDMDPLEAPSLYSYMTTIHALKERAQLRPGETMLVLGASGGIGTAAIEIGKIMGATVIAAASSPEKLAVCASIGADHLINYDQEDLKSVVREITGERGVDVVYDPVGGEFAAAAVRALAWRGRYITLGYATGTIPVIAMNLLLLKEASVIGSMLAEYMKNEPASYSKPGGEKEFFMKLLQERKLQPVVHSIQPMAEAADALENFRQRRVQGKIILFTPRYNEEFNAKPML